MCLHYLVGLTQASQWWTITDLATRNFTGKDSLLALKMWLHFVHLLCVHSSEPLAAATVEVLHIMIIDWIDWDSPKQLVLLNAHGRLAVNSSQGSAIVQILFQYDPCYDSSCLARERQKNRCKMDYIAEGPTLQKENNSKLSPNSLLYYINFCVCWPRVCSKEFWCNLSDLDCLDIQLEKFKNAHPAHKK